MAVGEEILKSLLAAASGAADEYSFGLVNPKKNDYLKQVMESHPNSVMTGRGLSYLVPGPEQEIGVLRMLFKTPGYAAKLAKFLGEYSARGVENKLGKAAIEGAVSGASQAGIRGAGRGIATGGEEEFHPEDMAYGAGMGLVTSPIAVLLQKAAPYIYSHPSMTSPYDKRGSKNIIDRLMKENFKGGHGEMIGEDFLAGNSSEPGGKAGEWEKQYLNRIDPILEKTRGMEKTRGIGLDGPGPHVTGGTDYKGATDLAPLKDYYKPQIKQEMAVGGNRSEGAIKNLAKQFEDNKNFAGDGTDIGKFKNIEEGFGLASQKSKRLMSQKDAAIRSGQVPGETLEEGLSEAQRAKGGYAALREKAIADFAGPESLDEFRAAGREDYAPSNDLVRNIMSYNKDKVQSAADSGSVSKFLKNIIAGTPEVRTAAGLATRDIATPANLGRFAGGATEFVNRDERNRKKRYAPNYDASFWEEGDQAPAKYNTSYWEVE